MIRCPSAKRLRAEFPRLEHGAPNLIRRLAHAVDDTPEFERLIEKRCPATSKYVHSLFGMPYGRSTWRRTIMLHAIDKVLGTWGVEPLGPTHVTNGPPYEYCNTGDAYAATLIYERDNDRLVIGSWGDYAERLSAHDRHEGVE